jgi:hypothetical protein
MWYDKQARTPKLTQSDFAAILKIWPDREVDASPVTYDTEAAKSYKDTCSDFAEGWCGQVRETKGGGSQQTHKKISI